MAADGKLLVWDADSTRVYETGVDHGVLYVRDTDGSYPQGVAWNGLTTVTESPAGAEANDLYADNIKYLSMRSAETFGATIEAYTYPKEFAQCNGEANLVPGVVVGQQARKSFGFAYRSVVGNDVAGDAYGYKLHLIYGCTASPSERGYSTINDSPEAITFSWEIDTIPVNVSKVAGLKATASITIDTTQLDPGEDEGAQAKKNLKTLEAVLFGYDGEDSATVLNSHEKGPRLPLPDEVYEIMSTTAGA